MKTLQLATIAIILILFTSVYPLSQSINPIRRAFAENPKPRLDLCVPGIQNLPLGWQDDASKISNSTSSVLTPARVFYGNASVSKMFLSKPDIILDFRKNNTVEMANPNINTSRIPDGVIVRNFTTVNSSTRNTLILGSGNTFENKTVDGLMLTGIMNNVSIVGVKPTKPFNMAILSTIRESIKLSGRDDKLTPLNSLVIWISLSPYNRTNADPYLLDRNLTQIMALYPANSVLNGIVGSPFENTNNIRKYIDNLVALITRVDCSSQNSVMVTPPLNDSNTKELYQKGVVTPPTLIFSREPSNLETISSQGQRCDHKVHYAFNDPCAVILRSNCDPVTNYGINDEYCVTSDYCYPLAGVPGVCEGFTYIPRPSFESNCSDGKDNDGDFLIDMDDMDCTGGIPFCAKFPSQCVPTGNNPGRDAMIIKNPYVNRCYVVITMGTWESGNLQPFSEKCRQELGYEISANPCWNDPRSADCWTNSDPVNDTCNDPFTDNSFQQFCSQHRPGSLIAGGGGLDGAYPRGCNTSSESCYSTCPVGAKLVGAKLSSFEFHRVSYLPTSDLQCEPFSEELTLGQCQPYTLAKTGICVRQYSPISDAEKWAAEKVLDFIVALLLQALCQKMGIPVCK